MRYVCLLLAILPTVAMRQRLTPDDFFTIYQSSLHTSDSLLLLRGYRRDANNEIIPSNKKKYRQFVEYKNDSLHLTIEWDAKTKKAMIVIADFVPEDSFRIDGFIAKHQLVSGAPDHSVTVRVDKDKQFYIHDIEFDGRRRLMLFSKNAKPLYYALPLLHSE